MKRPIIRSLFGLVGAFLVIVAFLVAFMGSASLLAGYIQEQGGMCGTGRALIRAMTLIYGFPIVAIAFGGCALAGLGNFKSSWWRFFRNVSIVLVVFTYFSVRS